MWLYTTTTDVGHDLTDVYDFHLYSPNFFFMISLWQPVTQVLFLLIIKIIVICSSLLRVPDLQVSSVYSSMILV